MNSVATDQITTSDPTRDEWFDNFVANLKFDKLQLDTRTAPKEKEAFYRNLIDGNTEELYTDFSKRMSQHFIINIVHDYLEEVTNRGLDVNSLGFELNNSSVLVWAVINDDDDEAEDNLILAQATVNAKYSEKGFYLSTTIVEKSDKIDIPSQYSRISN